MLFKCAVCHLGMEMGDVQLKLVRANPVKQLWLGNKKWGTNLQVYSCCLPVRDPKDAEMLTRDRRGWTAHIWADFTLEWPSGWKQVSCTWNIWQRSYFLYKQSWSSFRWEGMEFTSILAHNDEKISRSQLRSGSLPSEQAIFVMEKSQPLHRSALGICEKGSKAKLRRKTWNTIRE